RTPSPGSSNRSNRTRRCSGRTAAESRVDRLWTTPRSVPPPWPRAVQGARREEVLVCALVPPERRTLSPIQRREFRRTLAMAHRTVYRDVVELPPGRDAPQHQSAAAHVAPADELTGKHQP